MIPATNPRLSAPFFSLSYVLKLQWITKKAGQPLAVFVDTYVDTKWRKGGICEKIPLGTALGLDRPPSVFLVMLARHKLLSTFSKIVLSVFYPLRVIRMKNSVRLILLFLRLKLTCGIIYTLQRRNWLSVKIGS